MSDSACLGLALGLSAVSGALFAELVRHWQARPIRLAWRPLEALPWAYWAPHGLWLHVDEEALDEAVTKAVALLAEHGHWASLDLGQALRGLGIVVQRRAKLHQWALSRGVVVVRPDLGGLVHQLAHLLEHRLGPAVDLRHETWGGAGLATAEAEWAVWLSLRAARQAQPESPRAPIPLS